MHQNNDFPASTPPVWRMLLRQNFTDWKKLADFLELNEEQRQHIMTKPAFILNLPLRLAKKIAKGTLDDPLLRQFLPMVQEKANVEGFGCDPVGDVNARKAPKLLHKYQGRALLLCTSACAMHCRYCFRQHFEYAIEEGFERELEIIAQDDTIHEVILSGGDPLSLSDQTLDVILHRLSLMPHVRRIRFHTRFPIGIPERIDDNFVSLLSRIPRQIWFVIHSNHALELDEEVLARLRVLQCQGITVLNQSVLLRGVNDCVEVLKSLCERLVDHGIFPYYLHQQDRVEGAAHFEVPEEEGLRLMEELGKQIAGYAIPKYVRELAGEPGKTLLI